MARSYSELVSEVRNAIRTVSLEEIRRRQDASVPMVLVDVRETDEARLGTIPGAIHVPRGFLEIRIETAVPDKATPLVVYCAGGTRSALAVKTLVDLGYTHVESADPGFVRWRELGYPTETRRGLSDAQRDRYARHLQLPEIGERGQAKLLASRALVLGAGGLGSPAALYLAAAGVGTLGIVDADVVDLSNLQRQILHTTSRVGRPKVESAARALADLNPDVKVVMHEERITRENADRLFEAYDVVVDGCDNFPTRYLVNDASVFHRKPVVHGSIFRFEGQVSVFDPARGGPCYRCLYPEPPPPHLAPSCGEAGVLGVLPGVIGVLQATETLKVLLGEGSSLRGRVVTYDAMAMRFGEMKLRRDPACPTCGDQPTIDSYLDYDAFCAAGPR